MPKKILVVDDDPATRKLVKTLLDSEGYDVVTAHDGKEVLGLIEMHSPDAIIMDLIMPEKGGSETVEEIQRNNKANQIPILFLTAINTSDAYSDGNFNIQVGALTYKTMTKPFQREALINTVAELAGTP